MIEINIYLITILHTNLDLTGYMDLISPKYYLIEH